MSQPTLAAPEPIVEPVAMRRWPREVDPDPTDVMPRRVVAFVIDSAVCLAVLVLMITTLAPSSDDFGPGCNDEACSQPAPSSGSVTRTTR
ncbi:MAG: hypothetical protein U0W40_13345 [Acidimicrobiia bacterium]